MEVLAEAGSADEGLEAIQRVRRTRVVVLVGLGLAGEHDAYWLIRTLRQRYPTHAILACGANTDPTSISRALFVGADGFVDFPLAWKAADSCAIVGAAAINSTLPNLTNAKR